MTACGAAVLLMVTQRALEGVAFGGSLRPLRGGITRTREVRRWFASAPPITLNCIFVRTRVRTKVRSRRLAGAENGHFFGRSRLTSLTRFLACSLHRGCHWL